jgi:hypothetical protein
MGEMERRKLEMEMALGIASSYKLVIIGMLDARDGWQSRSCMLHDML